MIFGISWYIWWVLVGVVVTGTYLCTKDADMQLQDSRRKSRERGQPEAEDPRNLEEALTRIALVLVLLVLFCTVFWPLFLPGLYREIRGS